MPLLAIGVTADALKGPIASLNALQCDQEPQMQQLVNEMAKAFGDSAPQPSVYRKTLVQFVNLARRPVSIDSSIPISTSPPTAPTSLDPMMKVVLDAEMKRQGY